MATPFNCPACGGTIAAEVSPGSRVVCPLCRREIIVPGAAQGSNLPSSVPPVPAQPGMTTATASYSTMTATPQSQGMAIAALVCGIIGLIGCQLVGILGVIFGIIAVRRAGREPQRYGGRGLAIGGIATGGLSILLIPVLIAVLVPALSAARSMAKQTVCIARVQGIGQTLQIYAHQEPNGAFPELGADWIARLQQVDPALGAQMFTCPEDGTLPANGSYYYVPGYTSHSDPNQVLLYERPGIHGGGGAIGMSGGSVFRVSGFAEFVPSPQFEQLVNGLTLPDGTPWAPHAKHMPPASGTSP